MLAQHPDLGRVLRLGCRGLYRDNTLNFSFSPRSAYLMLIFGLSIMQMQGRPNFTIGPTLVTLGFRLSLERWNQLLSRCNLWNRRYLDYFLAMTETLVLSREQDMATLQSMVLLSHPVDAYFAVDYFNRLYQQERPSFYRLFHLPVPHFACMLCSPTTCPGTLSLASCSSTLLGRDFESHFAESLDFWCQLFCATFRAFALGTLGCIFGPCCTLMCRGSTRHFEHYDGNFVAALKWADTTCTTNFGCCMRSIFLPQRRQLLDVEDRRRRCTFQPAA